MSLVALDGHIEGHCAVVIDRENKPPLIHAGDAVMDVKTELFDGHAPLGLMAFQRMMRTDARAWRESRAWLKECVEDGIDIICAHEPHSLLSKVR